MGRKTRRVRIHKTHFNHVNVCGDISDIQAATDDIIYALDDSFNRRYEYRRLDGCWQLPPPTKFFREDSSAWHDDQLMSMKSRLNDVKGRLSSVDIVTWQNHTQVCMCHTKRRWDDGADDGTVLDGRRPAVMCPVVVLYG